MVATIAFFARAAFASQLLEDYCHRGRGQAAKRSGRMQVLLSDSATWVAVGLAIGAASHAIGAASLALIASLLVLLVVMRGRRSSYAAVEQLLRESLARTEALHEDLAAALEEARAETRRARKLGEIASTIDLDAVLTRTLEAAGALAGLDAGLIRLPGPAGSEPLLATLGMTTEEAEREPVGGPPGGRPARAVRIAYTTRTKRSVTRATSSAAVSRSRYATLKASRSAPWLPSGAARRARRRTRS
jgi:hypothetical protein